MQKSASLFTRRFLILLLSGLGLRSWRSAESLAEHSELGKFLWSELMVSLRHVLHCLPEPLHLMFEIRIDHAALHNVMEQLVARFGKHGWHGDLGLSPGLL
jgi:hypothetical protein